MTQDFTALKKAVIQEFVDRVTNKKAPIEILGLSSRAYHILRRYRIRTLQDLSKEIDNVDQMRGVGPKYLQEIREKFEQHPKTGATVRPLIEKQMAPEEPAWFSQIPPGADLRKITLKDLGLSPGFQASLTSAGIRTLAHLAVFSRVFYATKVPKFDHRSVQELNREIEAFIQQLIDPPAGALPTSSYDTPQPATQSASSKAAAPGSEPSIDELNLKTRTANALQRRGILTIRELEEHIPHLSSIKGIGPTSIAEVKRALQKWQQTPHQQKRHFESAPKSLPVAPALTPGESLKMLLEKLTKRYATFLDYSYGLTTGEGGLTLQVVGERMGVTRERVRQIRRISISKLRDPALHMHRSALSACITEAVERWGGVVSNTRLQEELMVEPFFTGYSTAALLELIRDVGLEHFDPALVYLSEIEGWISPSIDAEQVAQIALALAETLADSLTPLPWTDLYERLLPKLGVTLLDEQAIFAVALCMQEAGLAGRGANGCWETVGEGKKSTRRRRVMGALRDIGCPAHYSIIAKRIQELFPGEGMSERYVSTVLDAFRGDFVRVGRGTYGLAEWGLHDDGTIANAVRRVLAEGGEPMELAEIEAEVLKTWQVQSNSVYMAIATDARFKTLDDGRICLTGKGITTPKIRKRSDEGRRDRLVNALRALGKPASAHDIAHQHNLSYPENPLTPDAIRYILFRNSDIFVRTSVRRFGLAEWGLEPMSSIDELRAERIREILRQAGKPMHYLDIALPYLRKYVADDLISDAIVSRVLHSRLDDLFVRVDKGTYGLAEWGPDVLAPLEVRRAERIQGILLEAGKDLHHLEIALRYYSKYPDDFLSQGVIIKFFKRHNDLFVKTGKGIFGLIEWQRGILNTADQNQDTDTEAA